MLDYPQLFVQRLGEHDYRLLARLDDVAADPDDVRAALRRDPAKIEAYLTDSRLYEMVFSPDPGTAGSGTVPDEAIQVLSPSLAFAVLVHEAMRDLSATTYVPEWVGPGERLPVFDVASLREFIGDTARRHVIIELLGSFTRVASGSMWVRTRRGYRRRRYSELDPVSLAEMVHSLPEERRAPGYRRLGDVALFLTGVFPDHTERHPEPPLRRARLARTTGAADDWDAGTGYLHFLEAAGSRWYDRAADAPFFPRADREAVSQLAANFTPARRFLNYLADGYLHRFETGLMNPVG